MIDKCQSRSSVCNRHALTNDQMKDRLSPDQQIRQKSLDHDNVCNSHRPYYHIGRNRYNNLTSAKQIYKSSI